MRVRALTAFAAAATGLAAVAACGEVLDDDAADFPPDGDASMESSATDAAPADALPVPTKDASSRCAIGAAFGPKEAVRVDGDWSVEAVRFRADRTRAYVSLCPADGGKTQCDLWASEVDVDGGIGAHTNIGTVNAPAAYDSYPTVSGDSKFLLFSSSRDTLGIYVAEAIGGTFNVPNPTKLSLAAGKTRANEPYVLGTGETLYFAAGLQDGSGWDLFVARGAPPSFGGDGNAAPIAELNGPDLDMAPVVTPDELEIFFASNRATKQNGALDVYVASRAEATSPFGNAAMVAQASQPGVDYPVWISPDACDLYFVQKIGTSTTAKGSLYVARRTR